MRLSQYLHGWLELLHTQVMAGHLAIRTFSSYESAVRLHIDPVLGGIAIGDLNHLTIYRWLVGLKDHKNLSDRSIVRVYRTLHRSLSDSALPDNPSALPKHLRPVVRQTRETKRPTPTEIRAFLEHAQFCDFSSYTSVVWRVAAATGARRGELVAICWDDVDLERGTLRIERSMGIDGGQIFVKQPKSKAGRRLVGLDRQTVNDLKDHRTRMVKVQLSAGASYIGRPLDLNLAFRWDSSGNAIRPDQLSGAFRREWDHANLDPDVSLHSLRHSLASVLLREGHSITDVAAQMGHTPSVLLSVYGRDLDPDSRATRVAHTVQSVLGE